MSEPSGPADPQADPQADQQAALLAEAASKSGLVWLQPPSDGPGTPRAWPAWHVWHEGAVLVVSGPGEQQLPTLDGPLDLLLRSKDSGARLLRVAAAAEPLDPGDPAWLPAAQALAASRLNSVHSPAQLPEHWRVSGVQVIRVRPVGAAAERPGQYDQDAGSAAPVPTPASTAGWLPWHVGDRRRRRWGQRWRQSALGRRIRPRATSRTPPPT